ncbi:DegT/DnrJ/EryC1/StrS family aminotransferase [Streptomyces caelestis]|jgi:dTDP-4-amino-4,6-dideoxygalactose transaminase|uniref:dTDP-4-amino-4,6-dideoxygalactose transaminase n=1 Tax=Streptomyces caelestis TaxID=36816 RepID=A0A7W9LX71_9ACTN|nr:DegT/DnrJ/EryC1/StrS family aminotransferase [Streptomyces caelestis]MBB5799436.1 dTDP-4-amino-4,6-dideoxygalactose transaminase [Streptomyces caelestis]GGW45087.1 pleiotropic regulatory protein [Streptomyces caelestis]
MSSASLGPRNGRRGWAAGTADDTSVQVPFFTQARTFEALWPDIRTRLTEVFDNGKFSHGRQVARFEEALARWTGARYAVGVNSGTDALVLLLRACGLQPGDEVIVPAFTFVASASSVVLAGGRPVFADIDPVTYTIDPKSAADAVTPRTRMIMPVHLFCQPADMDAILDLARRHRLTVVEDSAEAIGMRWDGVHAGLLGAGGVLSFFPTKTLGAIGDAGAILTDDPQLAETAAALRHHGRHGRTLAHFPGISNETTVNGVNSKMDDIQAAVLLAKLARLHEDIARRARLAAAYTERLAGTPGVLRLPTVVPRTARTHPVFYVYLIEVERRDELAAYLAEHGVGTETYYPAPLHLQECFAHLGYRRGDFPHAETACERTLALPLYPDMSVDDVDTVCDLVRRFPAGRPA